MRELKRIFNRDSVNEEALNLFLSDPDMTFRALKAKTVQDGFSGLVDQLIKRIGATIKEGKEFTPQEKPILLKLRDMLNTIIK